MKKLISRPEMAKLLGVSEPTVARWCREGMPYIKFPGDRIIRFDPDLVQAWLETLSEKGGTDG